MHRTALCLRACRYRRLGRTLHNRNSQRLFNAGAGYQVDDDGNEVESLASWEDHHARNVGRKPVDADDVVIDDLEATLKAHRASNRASIIRKIDAPSDMPDLFLRPSIDAKHEAGDIPSEDLAEGKALAENGSKSSVDGDQAGHTQKGNIALRRIWPADSLQAQKGYGRSGRKSVRGKVGDDFVQSRGVLEYTGVPFLPKKSWQYGRSSIQLLQRPWLAYMKESSGDHLGRLSSEIRAYEAYMRLTPGEEAAAQVVMSDVTSITPKSLRNVPLTVLGSRSTGLATPLSDFDLTFSIASPDRDGAEVKPRVVPRSLIRQAVGSLREVEKDLRYSIKLQDTELVVARIPIIKTKHRGTGLRIQIQTMAPHQPAQEYSAAYLNELPSLRPLFIVLRYCLEIRGLATVYEGGLGSYSLLIMIVNALKHSSGQFASDDLAGQLLYVLYFYGSADLYQYGYSVNPPRVFDKLKEKWSMPERLARSQDSQLQGIDEIVRGQNRRKPYLLSLQDPANDTNDLGKNSYAIKHVQAVFNKAHQSILSALEQGAVRPEGHAKSETWSYLDHLVRADYKSFEENRSKVERFARDPLSKDYDYSAERITEDFQRRVQVHKGLIAADDYSTSSTPPTQQPDRPKGQGLRIRQQVAGSSSHFDMMSTDYIGRNLLAKSITTIRTLRLEWYDIKKILPRISASKLQTKQLASGLNSNTDEWTIDYLESCTRGASMTSICILWLEWYSIRKRLAEISATTEELPFIRRQYSSDIPTLIHQHLQAIDRHLWEEWSRIQRKSTNAEGSPIGATSKTQATPTAIKNIKIRRIDRKRTAAEIKYLTSNTANLEKRFQMLHARTEHIREEMNTISIEVAGSGRRPLTGRVARRRFNRDRRAAKLAEALRKDDNVKTTLVFIQKWFEMQKWFGLLRRTFYDLHRDFLNVTGRLARLNGVYSGVAVMQSRYEWLRRVKDDYWREFVSIVRRLASYNGQESAIVDMKSPLSGRRGQLRRQLEEVQTEIKETHQTELELETLLKHDVVDAEYSYTITKLAKRHHRELVWELCQIEAAFREIRQQNKRRPLKKECGNDRALEEPSLEITSPDSETAPLISGLTLHPANLNGNIQLQGAVETSASKHDTAAEPTFYLDDSTPQSRRTLHIRPGTRVNLFRSIPVSKTVAKLRTSAHNIKDAPQIDASGKFIMNPHGKLFPGEERGAPLPVLRPWVTKKQWLYRKVMFDRNEN